MTEVATKNGAGNGQTLTLWERYLEEDYDFVRPRKGDLYTGSVLEVHPELIVVDIGAKRDGFVLSSDLKHLDDDVTEDLEVGDEVPVLVERLYDRDGDLILSISGGRRLKDWQSAQQLLEDDEVIELQIDGYNKGGATVTFGQIRGFIPASHLVGFKRSMSPEERKEELANRMGQVVRLKVLEVDRYRRRLVMSQRKGERAYRSKRRQELLESLSVGDVVAGKVSSLKQFGAFVDIGGADGLVHVTELSHDRVRHPQDVLELGQEVKVKVIRLDKERERFGLSIKRLLPDPWESVDERYYPGQLVDVTITNLVDFGAFARLEEGVEGLIHISRLAYHNVGHPREVVSIGQEVTTRVLRTDTKRKRISLSLQDVAQWTESPPVDLHDEGVHDEPGEAVGLQDGGRDEADASPDEVATVDLVAAE